MSNTIVVLTKLLSDVGFNGEIDLNHYVDEIEGGDSDSSDTDTCSDFSG